MPYIIPIRDLKNTSAVADMVREANEPVFVTKNGYGEMVIMSIKTYEEKFRQLELYHDLAVSEQQFEEGKSKDARIALSELRDKYEL